MSNEKDHAFDESFREAFEQMNVPTPNKNIWKNLEMRLAEDRVNTRISFVWPLRWAATISILLSLSIPLIFEKDQLLSEVEEAESAKLQFHRATVSQYLVENLLENSSANVEGDGKVEISSIVINSTEKSAVPTEKEESTERDTKRNNASLLASQGFESFEERNASKDQKETVSLGQEKTKGVTSLSIDSRSVLLAEKREQFQLVDQPNTFEPVDFYGISQRKERWYIGGFIAPQLVKQQQSTMFSDAYRNTSSDETNYLAKEFEVLHSTVQKSIGFEAKLGYRLGNNWEIESGLSLSRIDGHMLTSYNVEQQLTTVNIVEFPVPSRTGDGYDIITTTEVSSVSNFDRDTLSSTYTLQTVEVPLQVRYVGRMGNFSYFVSSGVSAVLYTQLKEESVSSRYNDVRYERVRGSAQAPSVNLLVGAGLGYRLGRSLEIRVEPQYRRGLFTHRKSILNENRKSLGLNTGFVYSF